MRTGIDLLREAEYLLGTGVLHAGCDCGPCTRARELRVEIRRYLARAAPEVK